MIRIRPSWPVFLQASTPLAQKTLAQTTQAPTRYSLVLALISCLLLVQGVVSQEPVVQPMVAQRVVDQPISEKRLQLRDEMQTSWRNGDIRKAIEQIGEVIELEEVRNGPTTEHLAFLQAQLAEFHLEADEFEVARQHLDRAVTILRDHFPAGSWQQAESPFIAARFEKFLSMSEETRKNIFDLARQMDQEYQELKYEEVLATAEQYARAIAEQFGDRDPLWLEAMSTIQLLNLNLGRADDVGAQGNRLYGTAEQILHPDHPFLGKVLWLLAMHATVSENPEAALRFGLAAVEQYENSGAVYESEYAWALAFYADQLVERGQLEESLPILRKSLSLWREEVAFGESEDESIVSSLVYALEQVGVKELLAQHWDEAEELFQEALSRTVETWGSDYFNATDIRFQLARLKTARAWSRDELDQYQETIALGTRIDSLEEEGDYPLAQELARKQLESLSRLFETSNPWVLRAKSRLFTLRMDYDYFTAEELAKFKPELTELAEECAIAFGVNHYEYADICYDIASFLGHEEPEGIEFARKSVNAYRDSFTSDSDDYAIALTQLGRMLSQNTDEEAVTVLGEAIGLWETRASRGSYEHGDAVHWLGRYHYDTGYPYEARIYLSECVTIFRELDDEAGTMLAIALNGLANIYGDQGSYDDALVNYLEGLKLAREYQWDATDSLYAESFNWLLYNTGRTYFQMEQYADGEVLLRELIQRFPLAPPSSHDAFRSGCYCLAKVFQQLGKHEESFQVLQQATNAVEAYFPTDSLEYGELLLEQGELYAGNNELQRAEAVFDACLTAFQNAHQKNDMGPSQLSFFILLLDRLIAGFESLDAWTKAFETRKFAFPINEKQLASWPSLVATERQGLADAELIAQASMVDQQAIKKLKAITNEIIAAADSDYRNFAGLDEAEHALLLTSCSKVLGGANLCAADYRAALSDYWEREQIYSKATEAEGYAFQTYFAVLGKHPTTAQSATRFARLGRKVGQYQQAKSVLEISRNVLIDIQGENNHDAIEATLQLARLYLDIQDYPAALPLAKDASDRLSRVWGTENVTYAESLEVLGFIYLGMNEYELAADNILQSHEVIARLLEPSDRRVLHSNANRALALSWDRNQRTEARQLFQEVIAQYQQAGHTNLVDYLELLVAYGDTLLDCGELELAKESFALASASIVDLDGMKDEILRAAVNARLGTTQRKLGNLAEAGETLSKAVEAQRTTVGENSTLIGDTLFQRAIVENLTHNPQAARSSIEESLQLQQQILSRMGYLVSDKSLSIILGGDESRLDLLLDVLLELPPDQQTAESGFYWTVQQKGLALDVRCRQRAWQQSQQYNSQIVRLSERVRLLNQELADLALLQSDQINRTQLREQRTTLTRDIAQANSELALALQQSGVELAVASGDVDQVRKRLPADAVLIDYVLIRRLTLEDNVIRVVPRYVAFIVSGRSDRPLEMIDIGDAEEIDELISRLRNETNRVPQLLRISSEAGLEARYQPIARELYDKLLGPALSHLADCSSLIVSPDGRLSLVPFAALVDRDESYLVESIDVSYVSSSRDLLRERAAVGSGTVIISNPNFDADSDSRQQTIDNLEEEGGTRSLLVTRSAGDLAMRSLRWRRLAGAEGEAHDVEGILAGTLFEPVKKYLDNEAVEEVLKAARSPRIVHMATHGFYVPLEDEETRFSDSTRSIDFTSGLAQLRTDANPLLRSGIVLAGANRLAGGEDQEATESIEDGWVTAQEIAGMDFRNTELIVLSACESGLGDISNGQGVQGIRRAFFNAGAHSVLTSLYEVPDVETRELMREFYLALTRSNDRLAALSQAQRKRIADRRATEDAAHPFFWASFIILGSPEPPVLVSEE
jgi:CHAT domain-containing protein